LAAERKPLATAPCTSPVSEQIVIPSARDVRASLDSGDESATGDGLPGADKGAPGNDRPGADKGATGDGRPGADEGATGDGRPGADESVPGNDRPGADEGATGGACVVACPPHPQQRGHRGDQRLVAIGDRLVEAGVDCLRFDYGDWDEGYGELGDTYDALSWASERYDRVGLTGFSFGACLTLLAAGGTGVDGAAAATPDLDAVAALAPPSRLNDDLVAVPAMERIDAPATVVYGERDDVADWQPAVERAEALGWPTTALPADHFFVGRTSEVGDAVGQFLLDSL